MAWIPVIVWCAVLGVVVWWLWRLAASEAADAAERDAAQAGPAATRPGRVWCTTQPGAYDTPEADDAAPWVNTIPSGPVPLGDRDDAAHRTAHHATPHG